MRVCQPARIGLAIGVAALAASGALAARARREAGNVLGGTFVGKHGHLYRMGDGIALEPQDSPNAPNRPGFVSARVDPGKPDRHLMIYRLSTSR